MEKHEIKDRILTRSDIPDNFLTILDKYSATEHYLMELEKFYYSFDLEYPEIRKKFACGTYNNPLDQTTFSEFILHSFPLRNSIYGNIYWTNIANQTRIMKIIFFLCPIHEVEKFFLFNE